MSQLIWRLLTKKRRSSTSQGIPRGKENLLWVGSTVTLIYGERDAVLVDTFLTEHHARELVDWVVENGKNLTTIYVTHAHGDHFFGIGMLEERFPDAKTVATAAVVKGMGRQVSPEYMSGIWSHFAGQLPDRLIATTYREAFAQYSPDGKRIVFCSTQPLAEIPGLKLPASGKSK
jgi:glyoxylase-like metal-dependent hydrolase (beta-lactamase superfamily II)